MKCDLCGKEIDIDKAAIGSELCKSCYSMAYDEQCSSVNVASDGRPINCSVCQTQVYTYYKIKNDVLCGRCFEGGDATISEVSAQSSQPIISSSVSNKGVKYAAIYLALFGVMFLVLLSGINNPGNSGEGGVLLLPFVLPWILIFPDIPYSSHSQSIMILYLWVSAFLNSILIYLIYWWCNRPETKDKQPKQE